MGAWVGAMVRSFAGMVQSEVPYEVMDYGLRISELRKKASTALFWAVDGGGGSVSSFPSFRS
jgi:hypothetical protein